jgi:hypothetical protein
MQARPAIQASIFGKIGLINGWDLDFLGRDMDDPAIAPDGNGIADTFVKKQSIANAARESFIDWRALSK